GSGSSLTRDQVSVIQSEDLGGRIVPDLRRCPNDLGLQDCVLALRYVLPAPSVEAKQSVVDSEGTLGPAVEFVPASSDSNLASLPVLGERQNQLAENIPGQHYRLPGQLMLKATRPSEFL